MVTTASILPREKFSEFFTDVGPWDGGKVRQLAHSHERLRAALQEANQRIAELEQRQKA
jgi:vacuolar-type H+-ATPase catalytic subunit A/Vma1